MKEGGPTSLRGRANADQASKPGANTLLTPTLPRSSAPSGTGPTTVQIAEERGGERRNRKGRFAGSGKESQNVRRGGVRVREASRKVRRRDLDDVERRRGDVSYKILSVGHRNQVASYYTKTSRGRFPTGVKPTVKPGVVAEIGRWEVEFT